MDDSVIEETRGSGNNGNGNNGLTGEHPASNEEIQENEDLNQENDSGTSSDRDEEEEVEVGNDENVINNEDDDYSVLTIPLVDTLMREGLIWDGDSNGSIESDESDIGEGTSGEPEDGVVANLNNENSNNANGRGRELRNRYLEFLLGRYDGSGHDEGENNDYGDEDNFDDDDNDNESLRQARDHSYLPTAQPLYPEEWIPAGRHRVKQQRFDSSGNKKNVPERVTEDQRRKSTWQLKLTTAISKQIRQDLKVSTGQIERIILIIFSRITPFQNFHVHRTLVHRGHWKSTMTLERHVKKYSMQQHSE